MFAIHFFFLTAIVKQESTLFVSSKNQATCTFSCKLITVNNNWSINSPGETVVNVGLNVSENSHGNVYIEVLSKVVSYEHGVC